MREMIGTERDYVRSLNYIIENYMNELLRDDIPQALRGQRNVIFGNVERIYEFHQQFFLEELERFVVIQSLESFIIEHKYFFINSDTRIILLKLE